VTLYTKNVSHDLRFHHELAKFILNVCHDVHVAVFRKLFYVYIFIYIQCIYTHKKYYRFLLIKYNHKTPYSLKKLSPKLQNFIDTPVSWATFPKIVTDLFYIKYDIKVSI